MSHNIYWQIRFENSSGGVPNRVITCYKDATTDPMATSGTPWLTTVLFRDNPVNQPENSVLGVMFQDAMGYGTNYPWVVTNDTHWLYVGTGLHNGDKIDKLVGYEFDKQFNNGAAPANLEIVANSPIPAPYSSIHNAGFYTAPSGAIVFDAGTNYWQYMLYGDWIWPADTRVQRMTTNIFDKMLGTNTGGTLVAPTATNTVATNTATITSTSTLTSTLSGSETNTATPTKTLTATNTAPPTLTFTSTVTRTPSPTVPTNTPAPGNAYYQQWNNINADGGVAIYNLENNANFPNNPDSCAPVTSFDAPFGTSSGIGNWGGRIVAYLTPPVTGDYTFWFASDDAGKLFFNPNGTSAAGKQQITGVPSAAAPNLYWVGHLAFDDNHKSATFQLNANTSYYIEAYYIQGSGGYNMSVGWGSVAAGIPNKTLIAGQYLSPVPGVCGVGAATSTPTASATATATLTLTSTATPTLTATVTTSNTPTSTLTSSATVTMSATPTASDTPANTLTSTATATVSATATASDTPMNTLTSTVTATSTDTPINTLTATATSTLTLTNTPTSTQTASATGTNTTQPTLTATPTSTSTATASKTSTATLTPTYTSTAGTVTPGSIYYQQWNGINADGGVALYNLENNAKFPNTPNYCLVRTNFDAPFGMSSGTGNWGGRMAGYLTPQITGDYTFWFASDDNGKVFFNPSGTSAAGKQLIVSVPSSAAPSVGWMPHLAFDDNHKSVTFQLTANTPYYIEAYYIQGSGGYDMSVAWGSVAAGIPNKTLIAGQYLSPLPGVNCIAPTATRTPTQTLTRTATSTRTPTATRTQQATSTPTGVAPTFQP